MLPEFGVALVEPVFAEVGQSETPVAVGSSASHVAFHHVRRLAFESVLVLILEKWPEFRPSLRRNLDNLSQVDSHPIHILD
jgi:hypothetical protein